MGILDKSEEKKEKSPGAFGEDDCSNGLIEIRQLLTHVLLSDDDYNDYYVMVDIRVVMMMTTMTKWRNAQRGVGRRDAGLAHR